MLSRDEPSDGGQRLGNLLRPFILDDADVAAVLEQVGAAEPI